jgi:flagellar protein FliL
MAGSTEASSNKTLTIVPLLIATVAAVVVSMMLLMAVGYYVAKSGRLALLLARPAPAPSQTQVVVPQTHPLVLEPMVVNLADEGSKAYLRAGITLRVIDSEAKRDEKPKAETEKVVKGDGDAEAAVRDTALEVLGRQTAEELLAPEGKDNLKVELKDAIGKRNPNEKVTDVYFTEFLVQR